MLHLPIYLDYNATTPCDKEVLDAMIPFFTTNFGNAASKSHAYGWRAEQAVDTAREQVAKLIGAEPKEIIFTSGATEACNLAIKGVFEKYAGKGNHIITCNIEHKAVLDTCKRIEKKGAEVTYLAVRPDGSIDTKELEAAIRPETILIAIMYANNEIGTMMPVKEIGAIARKHGVLFFCDATQAVGKIPVDVNNDLLDIVAFSAHKMYGPKGVGALYVRRKNPRVALTAQVDGGGHERGWRSGTLNVPGIVGFGKACEIAGGQMTLMQGKLAQMRDRLEAGLLQIDGTTLNGSKQNRLPHVTNISFGNVEGEGLLIGIAKTIAVSSGSACTSASMEPSYVLKALGVDDELAHSSIRFSLGRPTTEEEVEYTIRCVKETVRTMRQFENLNI